LSNALTQWLIKKHWHRTSIDMAPLRQLVRSVHCRISAYVETVVVYLERFQPIAGSMPYRKEAMLVILRIVYGDTL